MHKTGNFEFVVLPNYFAQLTSDKIQSRKLGSYTREIFTG